MNKIVQNGIMFYVDNGTLTRVVFSPDCDGMIKLVIPHEFNDGTTIDSICLEEFTGSFGKVVISDGIKEIGGSSFMASSVYELVWPPSCHEIPEYCFYRSDIEKISGIENVTVLKEGAFCQSSLAEIDGEFTSLKEIAPHAFQNTKIQTFEIPEGCVLGSWAFQSCELLTSVQLPSSCCEVPDHCFSECQKLNDIEIPDSVTKIGSNAFELTAIKSFRWPSKCSIIPSLCFARSSLEELTGIEDVKVIEHRAFCGCRSLKSFVWPQSCHSVAASTFWKCKSLAEFKGAECLSSIAKFAFAETGFTPDRPLDLSRSAAVQIGDDAFNGLNITCVKRPYFIPEEEFQKQF